MPIEPNSESSSESNRTSQNWFAKCGLPIQTLSFSKKKTSQDGSQRRVMPVEKSSGAKRKRTSSPRVDSKMKSLNPFGGKNKGNANSEGKEAQVHAETKPPNTPQYHLRSRPQQHMAAHPPAHSGSQPQVNSTSGVHQQNDAIKTPAGKPKYSFDAKFDKALEDPILHKEYIKDIGKLHAEEDKHVWDRQARQENTNVNEAKADAIMKAFKEYERECLFGNRPSEALPASDTLDMGGQFLTNKHRIEDHSLVFAMAQMVPKGALLHLHFNAELSPDVLLVKARPWKNMYIRSIQPILSQKDLDLTETVFDMKPETTKSHSIFDKDYKGTSTNHKGPNARSDIWQKWQDFRKEFAANEAFCERYETPREQHNVPSCCGEKPRIDLEPAENWLLEKMVLSEDEAYGPTQTVNGVWARFNQATRCFKGLVNYQTAYEQYIGEAIDSLIKEKVMYAELRPMLLDKSIPTNSGVGSINNIEQMRLIVQEVEKKRQSLAEENRADDFPFGLKIIYCTPRSIPNRMMVQEMKECIDLKKRYPDLICGFDLVGAEDRGFQLGFYERELKAFRQTCIEEDLDIPFLFHAGESLLDTGGTYDPRNSNLYDAVVHKSKRIGHGFSLMKHPQLIEKFKRKEARSPKEKSDPGICVELCPISNELLHLCRNIKEHPYPELLAAGVPCTVNSDNPSLFRNSMSHEFYQIMVGAPTMTIYSWKQLALWSLEYSCLSPKDKERGKVIFLNSWDKFCQDVVEKYEPFLEKVKVDQQGKRVTASDIEVGEKVGFRYVYKDEWRINEKKAKELYPWRVSNT